MLSPGSGTPLGPAAIGDGLSQVDASEDQGVIESQLARSTDASAGVTGQVVVEGLADELGGTAALLRGDVFEAGAVLLR